jgi:hypothetical protein
MKTKEELAEEYAIDSAARTVAKFAFLAGWDACNSAREKEEGWVSVKERTPEVSKVLVAYKFGVAEAMFFEGRFIKDVSNEFPKVTHWKHLPTPPKEETKQ